MLSKCGLQVFDAFGQVVQPHHAHIVERDLGFEFQLREQLARQVTLFIQELREADLYKLPGVAETLDWTTALVALDQVALDLGVVEDTLGVILKYQDDIEKVSGEMAKQMLTRVKTKT